MLRFFGPIAQRALGRISTLLPRRGSTSTLKAISSVSKTPTFSVSWLSRRGRGELSSEHEARSAEAAKAAKTPETVATFREMGIVRSSANRWFTALI